jgi:hypothetical protein
MTLSRDEEAVVLSIGLMAYSSFGQLAAVQRSRQIIIENGNLSCAAADKEAEHADNE